MNHETLKKEIVALHPWHFNVDICDGITTEHSRTVPDEDRPYHLGAVTFLNDKLHITKLLHSVYPEGLGGKSLLDCACNCGAYCFWGKELGAEKAFGFDVREHWINQANFLLKHRAADSTNVSFQVCDLYDVPKLKLPLFDFTFFRGIFYHLPDPITGLKVAADLTKEVMYLDTATTHAYGEEKMSGALVASYEGVESYMSGVHRLNWYPTGPKVMKHILLWMGFKEVKFILNAVDKSPQNDTGDLANKKGRIGMLASKVEGRLDQVKCVLPTEEA